MVGLARRRKSVLKLRYIGTGGAVPVVAPKGTGGGSGVTGISTVRKLDSNEDVTNIIKAAISY